jgi:hypothetical protein
MLTIGNIRDLNGAQMNDWKVLDVGETGANVPGQPKDYYKIVFARVDRTGRVLDDRAGILIDRNQNPQSKYKIVIVYEEWSTIIYETELSKESISKKDTFFGLILYRINDEYYKRNT